MPTIAETNNDTKNEIRDVCYTFASISATATASVTDTIHPTYYDNTGAIEAITLTLPAALKGKDFTFERIASFQMIIQPLGSEYFAGSAAGLYKSLNADDTYINIKCLRDGVWHVLAQSGEVSDE